MKGIINEKSIVWVIMGQREHFQNAGVLVGLGLITINGNDVLTNLFAAMIP